MQMVKNLIQQLHKKSMLGCVSAYSFISTFVGVEKWVKYRFFTSCSYWCFYCAFVSAFESIRKSAVLHPAPHWRWPVSSVNCSYSVFMCLRLAWPFADCELNICECFNFPASEGYNRPTRPPPRHSVYGTTVSKAFPSLHLPPSEQPYAHSAGDGGTL